jgi:hypothetical protein
MYHHHENEPRNHTNDHEDIYDASLSSCVLVSLRGFKGVSMSGVLTRHHEHERPTSNVERRTSPTRFDVGR